MKSAYSTVEQYLDALPQDRRDAISAVRRVILENLDKDYEEGIQYGMIGYYIPHRIYPAGYHCNPKLPLPFAMLGDGKNYMSLHLMCAYHTGGGDDHPGKKLSDWFQKAWAKTGKKLDMGKACLRFKSADDLSLDVIGEMIRKVPAATWIETMQGMIPAARKSKPAVKKPGAKKAAQRLKKPTSAKIGK
jgi:Domain of unknown function (DU1801)